MTWMRFPLGFPPVQTDALTVIFSSIFTLKVRKSLFTLSPVSSSTGIYGIGSFFVWPCLTSCLHSPFGTVFWLEKVLQAWSCVGHHNKAPKERLGTLSANPWKCQNRVWYSLVVLLILGCCISMNWILTDAMSFFDCSQSSCFDGACFVVVVVCSR